jgi:peptide/nickel transport system permease protein
VTRFVARRLGQTVAVVAVVMAVVFTLAHLLPGGPARAILGQRATQAEISGFNRANGYDRPLPIQMADWIRQVATFHLGVSYKLNESVAALIDQRLPKTVLLMAISMLVALLVAVPLGSYQALHRNKLFDHSATGAAFVFYATPQYFLGILLILIFSISLHIFPPEAPQGTSVGQILSQPSALVLPVATLALVQIALFSRFQRSAILDNLYEDYVRTARAAGAGESRILFRHILRNALIPLVTLIGLLLPQVLSGALITEAVFNYPGMGLLFWQAAQDYDYPVLLGVTLIVAVATVVGNLLADIAYAVLDPRVRYVQS